MNIKGTFYFDLKGPEGNAFRMMGVAHSWAEQLGEAPPDFSDVATFNELLDRFDEAFKGRVSYRFLHDPRLEADESEEFDDEYEA